MVDGKPACRRNGRPVKQAEANCRDGADPPGRETELAEGPRRVPWIKYTSSHTMVQFAANDPTGIPAEGNSEPVGLT